MMDIDILIFLAKAMLICPIAYFFATAAIAYFFKMKQDYLSKCIDAVCSIRFRRDSDGVTAEQPQEKHPL